MTATLPIIAIPRTPPVPAASDAVHDASDQAAVSQPAQAATSATADPLQMSALELQAHAADIARVGDLILFDRSQAVGETRVWQLMRWGILRTQARMLADFGWTGAANADGARFVHAAILGDHGRLAEMDGHARFRALSEIPPGTLLRIRRPLGPEDDGRPDASEREGICAWNVALEDVRRGVDYPWGELFMYYGWSWGLNKLFLGRRFCNVFRHEQEDTCAAWAIGCWMHNGGAWFCTERSDAWYPGRVALSKALRTVCEIRITPSPVLNPTPKGP